MIVIEAFVRRMIAVLSGGQGLDGPDDLLVRAPLAQEGSGNAFRETVRDRWERVL